ncbi:MAG: cobalamin-binding protein [Candidatus Omnitrophica bacterium]|nr:cobalamin-binding protein [Candidatus Omnitrophota bacterium]
MRYTRLKNSLGLCLSIYLVMGQFSLLAQEAHPLRVISLAPATTEILFALGLDKEIVGVSQFCDYPEQCRTREKVGTFSAPNIEKIVEVTPDVIFCTGLEQGPAVTKLRQLGFKVVVSDPRNFKELFRSIETIGSVTGKTAEAHALVGIMKERVKKVADDVSRVPLKERPRMYIEIWYSPLSTAGRGSFLDELIKEAGGINIASDMPRPYGGMSPERVIAGDPECIVLAYMSKGAPAKILEKRFGWNGITALRNGRIYCDIVPNLLLRPGPRLVEGLEELHKRLYGNRTKHRLRGSE